MRNTTNNASGAGHSVFTNHQRNCIQCNLSIQSLPHNSKVLSHAPGRLALLKYGELVCPHTSQSLAITVSPSALLAQHARTLAVTFSNPAYGAAA
jgi:hypothetical protein